MNERNVIRNFDDLVEHSKLLPGARMPVFQLDPLEEHLMDVADKHGIIDQLLESDWEDEG